MKILSVDDSLIIRKIIKGAAEILGYGFLEASDGVEALSVLEQNSSDISLVLLDWNMPRMNGFELLKTLKSNPSLSKIPVMMVTTESEKTNIVQAIKNGASNYLTKPFSIEELIKKILETLGQGG